MNVHNRLERWFRLLILLGAGVLMTNSLPAQCLRTVNVTDNASLSAALSGALAGDCIVLANGTYAGFTVSKSGTPANPISIYALNQGGATISSSFIKFAGVSNVVMQGLKLTQPGGTLTVDATSRTVGVVLTNCNNCRITRCVFNLAVTTSTEWVFLGGNSNSNRIDHCEFGAKSQKGHYIFPCGKVDITGVTPNPTVDRGPWANGLGPFNPNMSRYTLIDHNYFHDNANATSESIVLGGIGMTGDYQGTFSTVEYNLFVNCDGDGAEIISTKSSTNTIRFNTVISSLGMFSLRAGNGSAVYNNFFLCAGKGGGVKVNEMNHKVYNNYVENGDASSYPIMLENGDDYSSATFGHGQVKNCLIVHNTVVNCGRPVQIGHTSTRTLKPTDDVFANNLLVGSGSLYSQDNPVNLVRSQNISWTQNVGSGFINSDPQLATVGGLQKLSGSGPAINAANATYSTFVSQDMDGQARITPDIGADEFSADAVVLRPLTTNDVGPFALESDFQLAASPSVRTILPGDTTNYTVSVTTSNGFAANVAFSVTGLPAGAGSGFSPTSVNGTGSSTLTITTLNSTPFGSYALAVFGVASNVSHSAAVTLNVGDFLVAATPSSQSIVHGSNAIYTVTLTTNNNFSGSVTFGLTGLPADTTASFSPPTLSAAGSSTLTVTTSNTVPGGIYPLTISATGGAIGGTANSAIVLGLTGDTAAPGILFWTGTNNWSVAGNWTNVTAGGFGPPGTGSDLVFTNLAPAVPTNAVNNTIDNDTTINSLVYANTNSVHNTFINAGRTLTIVGGAPGYVNSPAINVGLDFQPPTTGFVRATISGPDGTLFINNTNSAIQARLGFGSGSVGPTATLDLSGLGTFLGNLRRIQLGAESSNPRRVAGILYLARTNVLTLAQVLDVNAQFTSGTPALYLGHNTGSGTSSTVGSAVYLGISNAIFVNHIVIGRGNQTNNLMAFNPAFLSNHPTVIFRGSDGVSRVGQWVAGDNSAGGATGLSSGTNDFTGGTVDALVDRLHLGRGRVGTTVNTGNGTLTFDKGIIDVNSLRLGTMIDEATSINASGVGTANVNGTALLRVNLSLEMSHTNTAAAAVPAAIAAMRGTLNLNGGTVEATNILSAGGAALINLNSGTLDLKPSWATAPGVITNISTLNVGASGVNATALLKNAAAISTTNILTIASNGVIAGNTVITSAGLIVNGTIAPGAGVGSITNNGPATFGAGGRYSLEIRDANNGPAVGWDFLRVTAGINVQATSANPFAIRIQSLDEDSPGEAADFDNHSPYEWPIAAASGSLTNFAANKFAVDNGSFENDLAGGYFFVKTNAGSLILAFTNNHPPVASTLIVYRTGDTITIPIAGLASLWTDPDGDAVALISVNGSSTNGVSNVGSDGTYIYYTNATAGADAILYTIGDVRTNPPAAYRDGDSLRTASGLIQIVPIPAFSSTVISGSSLVLNGTNGAAGAIYYVLSSTNLSLPLSAWTVTQTNVFNGGNFSITNPIDIGSPQRFYLLRLQ